MVAQGANWHCEPIVPGLRSQRVCDCLDTTLKHSAQRQMEELHDFFVARVGAAAVLIGLLFVAITLHPENTVGPKAERERNARAIGAFSALANVFFVSLGGLIPKTGPKVMAVVAVASLV